jgi:hypothetical protein
VGAAAIAEVTLVLVKAGAWITRVNVVFISTGTLITTHRVHTQLFTVAIVDLTFISIHTMSVIVW